MPDCRDDVARDRAGIERVRAVRGDEPERGRELRVLQRRAGRFRRAVPVVEVRARGWIAQRDMIAAAHPLAAQAGQAMLKAGGTAVDAAIAAQMVLMLVEPQASGIGGGAFLLHENGKTIEAYDGRETAPAAATDRLFLDANGKPLPRAALGARTVGAPGALRMLE
ncbi:gamma-glutamyltransferase, partial [Burkholderia mallei]|nr:gamma-glutamyltransferase [Burkholderia mallei]